MPKLRILFSFCGANPGTRTLLPGRRPTCHRASQPVCPRVQRLFAGPAAQGDFRQAGAEEPYAFAEVLHFAEAEEDASPGAYAVLVLVIPRQEAGEAGQHVIH